MIHLNFGRFIMRFGVIGCGTVAGYGHIPALSQSKDAELVALSDVRKSRLDELGAEYGVDGLYTEYRDLLARHDIDAVTVATPLNHHYPVVMDALTAGKHVFCEKPIADTLEHGREMVRAAEELGKILAVDLSMRVHPVHTRVREIINSGEIGTVRFLNLQYNWVGPRWAGKERHEMMMTEGKGPIFDCGVHFFDAARWFAGSNYERVRASGIHMEDYPYPDHVVATCELENGAVAVINESWVFGHAAPNEGRTQIHRIEIEGDAGVIIEAHGRIDVMATAGNRTEEVRSNGKPFIESYRLFAESARCGRLVDLASGEDALLANEAAERALEDVARYR